MDAIDIPMTRQLTRDEAVRLRELGASTGRGDVVDRGTGVTMTSFYPGPPSGTVTSKELKTGLAAKIQEILSCCVATPSPARPPKHL